MPWMRFCEVDRWLRVVTCLSSLHSLKYMSAPRLRKTQMFSPHIQYMDSGFDSSPEDLSLNSGPQFFPSQSPGGSVDEEERRRVSVQRVVVVQVLVQTFMDNSIVHSTVK